MFTFGILLIIIGGVATISGELLGVFDKKRHDDNTISEWVWWFRNRTRVGGVSLGLVGVLGFLGWLAFHFTFGG